MYAWEAIQKSLYTIEARLSEEITIGSLADEVGLSPFYFQHLFAKLAKKPVNEYIKLRRLSKASALLKENQNRIMDIAHECGFSDHANFTRAFIEAFDITPEQYRNNKIIINQYVKPNLTLSHLRIKENTPLIADGIVLEISRIPLLEPRSFAGLEHMLPETELSDGNTTGVAAAGAMWQIFHDQKTTIPHTLVERNELGVLYRGNAHQGCCIYFTGTELEANEFAEGYAVFTLPKSEYVVCKVEAETFAELIDSAIFKAYAYVSHWMSQQNFSYGSYVAELYFKIGAAPCTMELWVPTNTLVANREEKIWDKNNVNQRPSLDEIDSFVSNDLWVQLRQHLESEYQSSPILEYSKCSAQHGWNVKYKKAGRSLCTLYPLQKTFIALIVIGLREQAEFEKNLPHFSSYLRQLYATTASGMGQKWLMINVSDSVVLEDIKRCISIRRGKKPIGVKKNANHLKD
jgi:AraC family transcriptional regulator